MNPKGGVNFRPPQRGQFSAAVDTVRAFESEMRAKAIFAGCRERMQCARLASRNNTESGAGSRPRNAQGATTGSAPGTLGRDRRERRYRNAQSKSGAFVLRSKETRPAA